MKKKFALLLAGVMTLSVLVTGCGGGSSAKKEEAPAAEPAQEAAAEPAAEAAAEPASDYEYPDVTWKVAHACQEGSPSDLGCKAFADYITEKSGGKIKFELYPAGQLGTDIAELESIQLGDLEFSSGSTFALQQVSQVDGCLMWDLPYFFHPFRVLHNEDLELTQEDPSYKSIFEDQLKEKNIHYINQSAHGNYIIMGNKAFTSPEDFKGVKMRAAENEMLVQSLQEWGAQPVVINMFELFTAMEQGTCDAAYVPDALAYQFSLQDACDYVTFFEGGIGPCYLSCSEEFYNAQDPEVQKLIDEAGQQYRDVSHAAYAEQVRTWIKAFQDAGCEVVFLTNEQKEALLAANQGTHAAWRERIGADLYDASQAYTKEALAGKNIEIPEY